MSPNNAPTLTVVSRSFPPRVSGSAILLANLLANYTGNLKAVAGENRYSEPDPAFCPPCSTQYLAPPSILQRVYDGLRIRRPALARSLLTTVMGRALKAAGTDVVLAAFPREDFLTAAFLAARRLRLPFYVHMHDLWRDNLTAGTAAARFADIWEPVILRQATRVLCMTEAMQTHYEKKYGLITELLPHTIPYQAFLRAPREMLSPRMSKPTVLFVGAVNPAMNLDALKVLASASELLPKTYELLYCTSTKLPSLHQLGIRSSRLRVTYVSRAEVQRLQSEAHVLIAPLSHKNCSMDEVRTVFSTKLLEYLISGRPIVVFAPEDSYHAVSARRQGWAYVVTEDSAAALAAAIVKVTSDENLAAQLVEGALTEAQSRNAKRHAERLQQWVTTDVADVRVKASTKPHGTTNRVIGAENRIIH
ncbi:MAG: glycosyltransferase [Candidatus Binatia bacterium]